MVLRSRCCSRTCRSPQNVAFGLRVRWGPAGSRGTRPGKAAIALRSRRCSRGSGSTAYGSVAACDELSGGQEQRVALARALVTASRAAARRAVLGARLRPARRDEAAWCARCSAGPAVTTLFVTHDQAEAVELADTGRADARRAARADRSAPPVLRAPGDGSGRSVLRCHEPAAGHVVRRRLRHLGGRRHGRSGGS